MKTMSCLDQPMINVKNETRLWLRRLVTTQSRKQMSTLMKVKKEKQDPGRQSFTSGPAGRVTIKGGIIAGSGCYDGWSHCLFSLQNTIHISSKDRQFAI